MSLFAMAMALFTATSLKCGRTLSPQKRDDFCDGKLRQIKRYLVASKSSRIVSDITCDASKQLAESPALCTPPS